MGIPNSELENLIEKSGVGSRTAKKLRKANQTRSTTATNPSWGHGAPSPAKAETPDF